MTDDKNSDWQSEAMHQNKLLHDALTRAETAEAKLTKAEEERDGYLAERNKFQLYLQRTHADLELEVAAVEALNAKLAKAVAAIRVMMDEAEYPDEVWKIGSATLAEIEEETK